MGYQQITCKICGDKKEFCQCIGRAPLCHTLMVIVNRPCMFFAKNDIVEMKKFREYFTYEAMKRLAEDGFITAWLKKD